MQLLREGDILVSDEELIQAIEEQTLVEVIMGNVVEDVGPILDFGVYWIQLPGNHFYFRDHSQISVLSSD